MFFSKEFIASVEDDPITGIVEACKMTFNSLNKDGNTVNWSDEKHELLWETASFVQLVIDSNKINVKIAFPAVSGNIKDNCLNLIAYLNSVRNQFNDLSVRLKIDSYKNRYSTALKASFAYEFSQGDLDRIQTLVNELRGQIAENEKLKDDHKRRLLKRLEHLQAELHKRVSDLDRFWGLIGDAGVVLGKLGEDAKPIVDRVREIAEIAWKTQVRTEELPSNSPNPMLEHDDNT